MIIALSFLKGYKIIIFTSQSKKKKRQTRNKKSWPALHKRKTNQRPSTHVKSVLTFIISTRKSAVPIAVRCEPIRMVTL